jgi:hypothetical protein
VFPLGFAEFSVAGVVAGSACTADCTGVVRSVLSSIGSVRLGMGSS